MVKFIKEIVWNILFNKDLEFVRTHYVPTQQLELIAELEEVIKGLKFDITTISTEETLGIETIKELENLIKIKEQEIKVLRRMDISVAKPEWLRTDNTIFAPKTRIATKVGEKVVKLSPTSIYTRSTIIGDIVDNHKWKELYNTDKKACAKAIWDFVVRAIKYEYDKNEDWRFSPISLAYKYGDCEDGTIMFLDLARESGFKADEVFNATGWVKTNDGQFGHSYPILNYGSGWYIYESTLERIQNKPMKFDGSKYTADWGVANWCFFGRIRNAKKQI